MNSILNDHTKFMKVPHTDPFHKNLLNEDKVNRLLGHLKKDGNISENEYTECYASGRSPGILYGLPKIHKPNVPLRPVLAAYNMPSYKLAKFLVPFLEAITDCTHAVKNSYELVGQLKNFVWRENSFMCSFDIVSLFTNIPLNETIELATNEMYKDNNMFRNLSKNKFKSMLEAVCKDTYFIFNEDLYLQTDGVAMGSPMSSIFANIFLGFHEKKWLDDCPESFKPAFYKRYVDDTLIIFNHPSHAEQFLDYPNSKHQNITFTIEKENENKIPFLDVLIDKANKAFSIYRKPTFTGLGMSFFSHCQFKFKINNMKTMIHRAYSLCSSYFLLHKELEFLYSFFHENGFPPSLFYREVRKFLDNIYRPCNNVPTVNKLDFYCNMPFIGTNIKILENELRNSLRKYYPQIKFTFIFNNKHKIGNLMPFKDRLPDAMRSGIVYLYNCPNCQVGYLGSSVRTLKTRFCQHAGISDRTGRDITVKLQSSIREHTLTCQTRLDIDNFKILDSCSNKKDLRILESIYIRKMKPQLNTDQSSSPLCIVD